MSKDLKKIREFVAFKLKLWVQMLGVKRLKQFVIREFVAKTPSIHRPEVAKNLTGKMPASAGLKQLLNSWLN